MSEVLKVAPRKSSGKLNNRRLRRDGKLPAVLYGHGKESVSLTVPAEQLETTLRHGAHVVELQGAADGQALLQQIQWDTFQQHVLHVDLLRVDASDRVTVEIPLVLRGEAPGEHEGGVVDQVVHAVEIVTSPAAIPENLQLSLNDLHLSGSLRLSDVEGLPSGAKFVVADNMTLVNCVLPAIVPEEEDEVSTLGAEPEIIGEKEGDEGSEAEG